MDYMEPLPLQGLFFGIVQNSVEKWETYVNQDGIFGVIFVTFIHKMWKTFPKQERQVFTIYNLFIHSKMVGKKVHNYNLE